jgi:hypothetical protein
MEKKIIYAIEVNRSGYGTVTLIDAKIGETKSLSSTIGNYRRSHSYPVNICGKWETNKKNIKECEKGIHKLAEFYSITRFGENFIFHIDKFGKFLEHVSFILPTYDEETKKIIKEKTILVKNKYVGTKPNKMYFKEKEYNVETWCEVWLKSLKLIASEKTDFEKVKKITGKKRPYFTKEKMQLRTPRKIEGTDLYVETNFSATSIMGLLEKVKKELNYKDEDIKIIYE